MQSVYVLVRLDVPNDEEFDGYCETDACELTLDGLNLLRSVEDGTILVTAVGLTAAEAARAQAGHRWPL